MVRTVKVYIQTFIERFIEDTYIVANVAYKYYFVHAYTPTGHLKNNVIKCVRQPHG